MEMPQAGREQMTCFMKELMTTTPVPRIRIKKVCRGSKVRVRAFRSEYRNKQHFLEWIFFSEFVPRITKCQGDSERVLQQVCAYFDENRSIYRTILTPRRQNARRSIRINAKRNALVRSFNLVAPMIAKELIETRYADVRIRSALMESCPVLLEMFRDALFRWIQAEAPDAPDAFAAACLAQLDEFADVSAGFGTTE